jgi:hypothetical protein
MSLKIQVLGKGLIPRGYGLAPRKDPFNADLTLIQTILSTPGLKINYIRPEDNKLMPLDKTNVMRIWNKYHNTTAKKSTTTTTQTKAVNQTRPYVPAPKVTTSTPVTNTTTTTETAKIDEDKEDTTTSTESDSIITPINAPEEKKEESSNSNSSNNGNNYTKHNKHNR